MYLSIAIKLLVGMLGVIFFLRISGKTQMAQLTPLDSVNSFVLGALVGGVIYNPDTPVWYLVFAFAVWTAATDAPFICLEPWYGHSDFSEVKEDFYHREGTQILSAGQTFTTAYAIEVF